MKVKTTMRQMKDAKVSFISLVTRGANRIPFRVLKSQGEDNMLDLSKMAHVFKNEPAPAKTLGFAAILRGSKPAPQTVAKAAPVLQSIAKAAPVQSIAKPTQQRQQVAEERQRQGLAPNQPLHAAPAPRRAGNTPKQPVKPSSDSVSLQSLKTEIDSALAAQRKREKEEAWNEGRSAFSQIAATQPHHVGRGGSGNAYALRNYGGALAASILNSTTRKGEHSLPSTSAWRPMSGESLKA